MPTLTLGARDFGFLVEPANGDRSFGAGPVAGGTAGISAGAMVADNAGTWEAIAAAGTPEAIVCEGVAATETEARTVLLRDATVNGAELVYPTGASAAEITAINAALLALGIVVR